MNNWVFAALGAMIGGIITYFWQKSLMVKEYTKIDSLREKAESLKNDAEREKSNMEVALTAKCKENEQLRKDADEWLKRQANQFHDEIQTLNDRLNDLNFNIIIQEIIQKKYI